jgi:hypothetical protein
MYSLNSKRLMRRLGVPPLAIVRAAKRLGPRGSRLATLAANGWSIETTADGGVFASRGADGIGFSSSGIETTYRRQPRGWQPCN